MRPFGEFGVAAGFTLVELLVSTAIIALIMLVLVAITNQTTLTWQYTAEKIEKFQESRDGFESMTRRLSQATLNTYWDYLGIVPPDTTTIVPRSRQIGSTAYKEFVPLYYGRMSELRFVSGPMNGNTQLPNPSANTIFAGTNPMKWPFHGVFFQAPFGLEETADNSAPITDYSQMDNLLNTWGYFLEVGEEDVRPDFIEETIAPKRWRSRLMEYMEPAERMMLNDPAVVTDPTTNWFSKRLLAPNPPRRMLAENIIALIILPKLSKPDQQFRETKNLTPYYLSPQYIYDSTLTSTSLTKAPANPGNDGTGTDPAGVNPHHQLPPVVQVVMVAIDERSAARMQAKHGNSLDLGLKSAAGASGVNFDTLFTVASKLEVVPPKDGNGNFNTGVGDLYDFEKILVQEKLTYRIFSTNVTIRGAKWSRTSKF
jgi:uncharacterized protein (TIGR02599 family)